MGTRLPPRRCFSVGEGCIHIWDTSRRWSLRCFHVGKRHDEDTEEQSGEKVAHGRLQARFPRGVRIPIPLGTGAIVIRVAHRTVQKTEGRPIQRETENK